MLRKTLPFSLLHPLGLIPLLALTIWLTLPPTGLHGQANPPATLQTTVTADDVNQVARELWCPLCSGVRLDSCELKACNQMKEVIAIKLSDGENVQSIKDYFVEYYGPQVLGEPPRSGFNLLAWILPIVVAAGGGIFLWLRTRRMVQPMVQTAENTASDPAPGSQDEYERKLEEELRQYD